MILGFPTVSIFNDNYYDYLILSSILGGGMASRLFHEIREKRGLVYTISSDQYSYTDSGILSIYAGTGPKQVEELVPVVCEELIKASRDINIDEVTRSKKQMEAGLLMGLESTSNRCERLARQMHLYNKPIPIKDTLERIEKVSVESVKNACAKMIKSHPTLTALGVCDHLMEYKDLLKKFADA